jgi:hypothetical protein
MQGAPRILERG